MQIADREGFDEELGRLCAGYAEPVTKHRAAAFWSGLAKMSRPQFSRCVDFALSEQGPDELPSAKGIWKLHRQLRTPGATAAHTSAQLEGPDHLEYFANRLLFMHLSHRGGLGSAGRFVPGEARISGMNDCKSSDELQQCLEFKRQVVTEFTGFIRDGDEDATPAVFYQWWLSGLRRISKVEKRTIDALNAAAEHPDALKPFDKSMARELAPTQPELV